MHLLSLSEGSVATYYLFNALKKSSNVSKPSECGGLGNSLPVTGLSMLTEQRGGQRRSSHWSETRERAWENRAEGLMELTEIFWFLRGLGGGGVRPLLACPVSLSGREESLQAQRVRPWFTLNGHTAGS